MSSQPLLETQEISGHPQPLSWCERHWQARAAVIGAIGLGAIAVGFAALIGAPHIAALGLIGAKVLMIVGNAVITVPFYRSTRDHPDWWKEHQGLGCTITVFLLFSWYCTIMLLPYAGAAIHGAIPVGN